MSFFFSERVINVWNSLPVNNSNFGSLYSFKKSLNRIYLSKFFESSTISFLWYLCLFDLYFVSYIALLLV